MLKIPYLLTWKIFSKSCKIWTNDSSHLKLGDILDVDRCLIHAEKEKKLSDSFFVIHPKPPKMTVFGIKMAAKLRRTIQSIWNLACQFILTHILFLPNKKKSYHADSEIQLLTHNDDDDATTNNDADDADDADGRRTKLHGNRLGPVTK